MATVLIIEDNPQHMKIASILLASDGHTVLKAGNAEEGVALAREQHPDLVLLDIVLPGMDGLTALRKLRDSPETKSIKVIMVTSLRDQYSEAELLAAGAHAFIAKPYHYSHFLDTLHAVLVNG